jgi:hypothetical protein
MPFTPRWNAQFAKPLLNQMIALIQRDQAAAIAIVNAELKLIRQFHKGRAARVTFPWCLVWIADNVFNAESDLTRDEEIDAYVAIEVGTIDQEDAQDQAHDYLAVIDSVIESASGEDWETALPVSLPGQNPALTRPPGWDGQQPVFMTSPSTAGTVKRVQVVAHRVDAIMVEGYTNPAVRATVRIAFHLEET